MAEPFDRHEIIQRATAHALRCHEDPLNPPLTPYGIASCAASMAYVLATPGHWNHRDCWARTEPEAAGNPRPHGSE